MKLFELLLVSLWLSGTSVAGPVAEGIHQREALPPKQNKHLRPVLEKRQQFDKGEPIDAKGKGSPILGEYSTI